MERLLTPLEDFANKALNFMPNILAMLAVLVIGLVLAWILKLLIVRLLKVVRFDQFGDRMGFSQALSQGGLLETPSHLAGRIFYWIVLIIFIAGALSALDVRAIDDFITRFFTYIPQIIIALAILVVGLILANFFARAVLIAAVNARIRSARLIARGTRVGIILFVLAMAMEQLGIARTMVIMAFSITFGGAVLALAIAFGLAARDLAKELLEKTWTGKGEGREREDDLSHL